MLKYERRNRALAGVSVLLLLLQMFAGVSPQTASAASVSGAKDVLTRHKTSTAANHTITFTTPTGVAASATITLTFAAGFSMGSVAFGDIDLTDDGTDVAIAASPSGATWGANRTGQVITLTNGTSAVAATSVIVIEIGTHATFGTTGTNQITNPSSAASAEIAIAGTFGDSGELDVPIMDDDQVTVTASVDTFITFDIDTTNGHGDSNTPYSVNLQELTFGSYNDENTSGVNEIYVDLDTNAASGVAVDVRNANGSNGLSSSSTSDNIPSATGALTTGTNDGRYGIAAASLSGLSVVAPYTQAAGNVGVLSSTFAGLFTVSGPVASASGQVNVRAISGVLSAAADDYTDTLTFRATATF
jgi:hypothetical protein